MTQTIKEDIVVRAHLEYAEAYKCKNKVFGIADGGADSVVLGKHAHVLHETGRYATLVGYDPKNTRSQRVPIVTSRSILSTVSMNSTNTRYNIQSKLNPTRSYVCEDIGTRVANSI